MKFRHLSVVGFGLGLLGSLATLVAGLSLAFSGVVGSGLVLVPSLVSTALCYRGLANVSTDEEFDVKRSTANRVANWLVAATTAAVGLLLFVVGLVSLRTYGI